VASPMTDAARNIMAAPVYTVAYDTPVRAALRELEERGVGALVVEDAGGAPLGVVTRAALSRAASGTAASRSDLAAGEVMAAGVPAVAGDASIDAVARRMVELGAERIFVEVAGRIAGVIGAAEMARAVVMRRIATPLRQGM